MKFRHYSKGKRIMAMLLAICMIAGMVPIFATNTFSAYQEDRSLLLWQGYNDGQWVNTYAARINITSGEYQGTIAYCIQNMKNGPKGEEYVGISNPGQTYYGPTWAQGIRAILQYGYPNVSRPFNTQSDDEAYYATTQAIRFWVAENGSAYNYPFSDLSSFTSDQLRAYAQQGEIPYKIKPLNDAGQRALICAIELLIKARNLECPTANGTVLPVNGTGEDIMSDWEDTNGNGTKDEGDYFVSYWDIKLGNTTSALIDITLLPLGTLITDVDGNQIGEKQSPGNDLEGWKFTSDARIKISIPYVTGNGEGAETEKMSFRFLTYFNAKGLVAPGNVILAEPANEEQDVTVQRLVFATDKEYLVGTVEYGIDTPSGLDQPGKIVVKKINGTTGDPISGVAFDIYRIESDKTYKYTLAPFHTNENGVGEIAVPPGTYRIDEVEVPAGYDSDKKFSQQVTVNPGQSVEVEAPNYPKDGTITLYINKIDADTQKLIKNSTAKFKLYNADKKVYVSNKTKNGTTTIFETVNGVATIENLTLGTNYILTETKAPSGYELKTDEMKFSLPSPELWYGATNITNKESMTINVSNKKKQSTTIDRDDDETTVTTPKSSIKINKIGEKFEDVSSKTGTVYYTPSSTRVVPSVLTFNISTNKPLAGASINVKKDGVVINSYVTGDSARTISNLNLGNYTVEEVAAPRGYVRDTSAYNITLGNKTAEVTLENKLAEVRLYLKKAIKNVDGTLKTSGINGDFVFGLYNASKLNFEQGVLSEDTLLLTFTNNNDNYIELRLPEGEYYVKELGISEEAFNSGKYEGLGINQSRFDLTVNYDNISNGVLNLYTNNNEYIINEFSGYTVDILKTNESGKVLEGAHIEVYRDVNGTYELVASGITNVEGKYTLNNPVAGHYRVVETKAPNGYVRSQDAIEFEIDKFGNVVSGTTTLINKKIDASITKTDLVTGDPVPGATIRITKDDGTYSETFVTDKDGMISVKGLGAGTYSFVEEIAPSGYIKSSEASKFTIGDDGTITGITTLTNAPTKVVLHKTDATTAEGIPDALITIYDQNGNAVYRDRSDENGEITIMRLPVGTYTFKETEAPRGYILNETEFTFTINADGTVEGDDTITNERSALEIIKVDVNDVPLPGVKFDLYDGNTVIGKYRTDKDGRIYIGNIDVNKEYALVETETLAGFALPENAIRFAIDEDGNIEDNGTKTLKIVNEQIKVVLDKQDTEGNYLAGAVLNVKNDSYGYDQNFTSNSLGLIEIWGLQPGTYKLQEVTPPTGYNLNPNTYEFTVDVYGNVSGTVSIVDTKFVPTPEPDFDIPDPTPINPRPDEPSYTPIKETPKADVTITKVNEDGEPMSNVRFEFYRNGNKLYTKETNIHGEIYLSGLTNGTYTYKEIATQDGYLLSNEIYEFIVKNGKATGDMRVVNYRSTTEFGKSDMDGTSLPGAKLAIKDIYGDVLQIVSTGPDGRVTISGLGPGTYYIQEVEAPNGYAINPDMYQFTITEDYQVLGTTTIKDDFTRISLYKTDEEGNPLGGAQFGLFLNGDLTSMYSGTTDSQGRLTFVGVRTGDYILKEIVAPDGYRMSESEIPISVTSTWLNTDDMYVFVNTKIPEEELEHVEEVEVPMGVMTPTPKTGDDTPVACLAFMTGGAMVGMVGMMLKLKKNDDDDDDDE